MRKEFSYYRNRQLKVKISILGLFLLLLLGNCKNDNNVASTLTIAAAANVQYAMKDILNAFENEKGIKTHLITSSSGKLTAQINEGAPYDVFISADLKYPMSLYESGISNEKPTIYAQGKLVLWTTKEDIIPSIEILKSNKVSHIAIANTKTAPYGKAAMEALINLGIYQDVEDKLVFGESIAQTTQFINSGAAEIGFTAKSIVLSPQLENTGRYFDINPELHNPIIQGMVGLNQTNSKNNEWQKLFFEFMQSDKVKDILQSYGYLLE